MEHCTKVFVIHRDVVVVADIVGQTDATVNARCRAMAIALSSLAPVKRSIMSRAKRGTPGLECANYS